MRTLASVVVIGILFGYCAGIFQALWAPVLAVLSPDPSDLGTRMGISYAFMALGGLIGPPISGALLTGDYIWWRGAVFNGIMGAIGCSCFIAMQIVLKRRDHISQ